MAVIKRTHLLAVLIVTGALLVAGCGSSSSSSSSHPGHRTPVTPTSPAQKANFVGHAGLAFGAFRRYVYVPFESGSLRNLAHNKLAALRARAAIAAATHEIVLAKHAAESSTALRKLFGPLTGLEPTLQSLAANLHRGHVSPAGIRSLNGQIAGVEEIGSAAGVKILERAPSLGR